VLSDVPPRKEPKLIQIKKWWQQFYSLFFSLVGTSSVEWCNKRSFPHKNDSRIYIKLSEEMVVLPYVLFKIPATLNNNFASATSQSGCQALIAHKFNKTKIISKQHFCIFGFKRTKIKTTSKLVYSLWPILLFANTDVSITKMCLDTSILAKSIMGRREYKIFLWLVDWGSWFRLISLSQKYGGGDSTNDKLRNMHIYEVIDKHGHEHHVLPYSWCNSFDKEKLPQAKLKN
jgi:hypothetical protein